MKKNKQKKQKKIKRSPKLLSIVLLSVLTASAVIDGFFAYDLFGKSAVVQTVTSSSGEIELTEDEKEAKAEREAREKILNENLENGNFTFEPYMAEELENSKITNESEAFEALKEVQYDLGIEDAENMYRCIGSKENEYYTYYTMQQYHEGIKIHDSKLIMQVSKDDHELIDISGKYQPIPDDLDTNVKIYSSDAKKYAKEYLKNKKNMETDDLRFECSDVEIFPFASDNIGVGYSVDVYSYFSSPIMCVVIDGITGDVIGFNENISYESAVLKGQIEDHTVDIYKESDEKNVLWDQTRNIKVYTTPVDNLTDTDQLAEAKEKSWNPKTETPDPIAVDALANIAKAYDAYDKVFNVRSTNDEISVYINTKKVNDESYVNNAACIFTNIFLVGVPSHWHKALNTHVLSAYLDVLGHEYTHAITNAFSTLHEHIYAEDEDPSYYPQKGISEGLADIMGLFVEDYWAENDLKINGTTDWVIGPQNINRSTKTANNNQISDYYDFSEGSTECHQSCYLVSHPAYYMTEKGVEKIPAATTAQLYFNVIQKLVASTDFVDFRKIAETEAQQMNQNFHKGKKYINNTLTDKQFESVIDAFDQVGIPQDDKYYRVETSGEIKVYGKNNKINSNYHIKIQRIYSGAEALVDEDVHTESYTIPSTVPNGMYTAVLTDLEDTNLQETIPLVINDNISGQNVDEYPSTVRIYTEFGTVPRDVVLVIDVSGSMEGDPIMQTKTAALGFINTVLSASPSSRISIVPYSSSAEAKIKNSNKHFKLNSATMGLGSGGGTNIYEGMEQAKNILDATNTKKKSILLLSDGAPNEGPETNGDYNAPIIELANTIKESDITIYTLGFYHNLSSSELPNCQELMNNIASQGYSYIIDDSVNYKFMVDDPENEVNKAFNDFAEMVNGKTYLNIRIACPVDVSVSYNGEVLDSASGKTRASFGSLVFERETNNTDEAEEGSENDNGEEDLVKILRLETGTDYEICVNGTGSGKMDYTISYPDEEGNYTDVREFKNIPVTSDTYISANTKQDKNVEMLVDSDGNGKFDLHYTAKENSEAKAADEHLMLKAALIAAAVVGALLLYIRLLREIKIIVLTLKQKAKAKKRICTNCGAKISGEHKFCNKCGSPVVIEEPESIACPIVKGNKFAAALKIILIVLLAVSSLTVYLLHNSAATSAYKLIRNNNITAAKTIYDNEINGSAIESKYFDAISKVHLDRVNKAYSGGMYDKDMYLAYLDSLRISEIGAISKEAGVIYNTLTQPQTETTSENIKTISETSEEETEEENEAETETEEETEAETETETETEIETVSE